jgi:hypothetical protein
MIFRTQTKQQYLLIEPFPELFPIPFMYWDTTDIKAVLSRDTGDEVLFEGADYRVSDPGSAGGTLTRLGSWEGASRLTVYREMPAVQEVDLRDNTKLMAELIEQLFDKSVALIQQLEESNTRMVQFPITDTVPASVMPSEDDRRGKFLSFDEEGKPVASSLMLPQHAIYRIRVTVDGPGIKVIPFSVLGLTGTVDSAAAQLVGFYPFIRTIGVVVQDETVAVAVYYDTYPYTSPRVGAPRVKIGARKIGAFKIGGVSSVDIDLFLYGGGI